MECSQIEGVDFRTDVQVLEVELLLDSHERAQSSSAPSSAQSLNVTGITRSLEGNCVGPDLVGARVGAGGMGEVYKARDTRLNRTVAIKGLPAHMANDSQARGRFEQEARAVAGLNHPHICTLYDIGSQDGVDFLVMEYLDGDTLSGSQPAEEALRLATQIAGAIADAPRHGIFASRSQAATRATVLDSESAEAHNALAVAALLWQRDFGKAEREFAKP